MTQPFLGQIQPFGFNFPPRGWAFCNGQILPITQNTALFSLLGTFYGGNGTSNFALPDLQSRVPMHYGTFAGNTYSLGEQAGEETFTLGISNLPAHTHSFSGTSDNADIKQPLSGAALAQSNDAGTSPGNAFYAPSNAPTMTSISPNALGAFGNNLPHNNVQPYLTISWCIALTGIYPSRN